ncbi:COP23 domain-containing protein [Scytonema sp. PCC 10023]|uniref:COP23 domain-containing protein n=1 Tax=Scytonema sp. PCC 10023 TaxID=1680591 RepID=UPI0039C6F64D
MKFTLFVQVLSAIAITLSSTAINVQPSYAQTSKFFCGMSRGNPATLVNTDRGNKPIISWVDMAFPPPWTPWQRCEAISERFNRFYENGTLKFIRAGELKRQPVLCVASYSGGPCLPDGVLVTLKPGTNPQLILYRLLNKSVAGGGRMIELTDNNNNVISNVDNASYLDVQKLIGEEKELGQCPSGQPIWEC